MAKNGYNPTKVNYLSLITALLKSNDIISAIEALQEVGARQMSWSPEEYQSIQKSLVNNLTMGKDSKTDKQAQLDNLYVALVDQKVKGDQEVPTVVLDAIMEAAGQLDYPQRAVSTFNELVDVFQVTLDAELYNSLLKAMSFSEQTNTDLLLSIMQNMEEHSNIKPNAVTFSILVEALIERNEKAILSNIVHHVQRQSVMLQGRAARRLLDYLSNTRGFHVEKNFLANLNKTIVVPYSKWEL